MAEIRLDHEDTLHHERHDDRHGLSRKLLLPALALLLGLLMLWGFNEAREPRFQGAERLPTAPLAASGNVWVPNGAISLLPDRQMVKVGETSDGTNLYALPSVPAGGGGGPAIVGPNNGMERAWVRIGDDRYQPVSLMPIRR